MPWLTSLYNPANMRYALRIAPTYPPPCSCKMILSRFTFSFDSKSSMVKCSISIVCMVKHSGHFHGGSAVPICLRSSPFFIFFPISKSFVVWRDQVSHDSAADTRLIFSHSLYLCSIFRCQKTAAPPDIKAAASADMKSSPQFRSCPPVSYDQRTQKQCRRKCKRQQGKKRRPSRSPPHTRPAGQRCRES